MSENLTAFSIPLFPLGTVLFPGGVLPLRIFEVRYLDMISKCHRSGSPFGVVTLTQGVEVQKPGVSDLLGGNFKPEAFHPVGTLAVIDEFSMPQPGLIIIRCTGTERFRTASSDRLNTGLWFASATALPDDMVVEIPPDLARVSSALGELIAKLTASELPKDQIPVQPPYRFNDCGWVANRWCELMPMPLLQKHRLMALDNPLVRLELVSDLLARSGILQ